MESSSPSKLLADMSMCHQLEQKAVNRLLDNMKSLLQNGKHSDVVLCVGNRQFAVHKAIICARSPVLAAMFENETKERRENRATLVDIDAQVFEQLLLHIYTGRIPSLEQHAMGLFSAADMYQFDELKAICEEWLCSNLTTENVSDILVLADLHSATKLKTAALKYIIDNASTVMSTRAWINIASSRLDLLNEACQHLAEDLEMLMMEKKNKRVRLG